MEISWINDSKLMVFPRRASATGNFYYGLLEYEPMAFVYHYISDEDVFFDIGANIGAYSVLGKRAKYVVSFEPAEDTRDILAKNFNINNLDNGTIVEKGVSDNDGTVLFTNLRDCVNHIVDKNANDVDTDVSSIEVVGLDSYISKNGVFPTIIKIDTEGAEENIIKGAEKTLSDERLNVIIMEIFEDERRSNFLIERGFLLYNYNPKTKELKEGTVKEAGGTGIYIRNIDWVRAKVQNGKRIIYQGVNLTELI